MVDADSVFEQFSDALRFPSYFGWNWPALSDCLRDLHWLPADRYLVVIENAPRVLQQSVEEREALFGILDEAGRHWATFYEAQNYGNGHSFQTILLCDEHDAESLEQEIAAASRP